MPKKGFLKDASLLVSGTIFAQFLTMVMMPVITRLYDPGDFGVLAVYISILSVFGVISSLRYDNAIPMADCNSDAYNLFALSLIINILSIALIVTLYIIFNESISVYIDDEAVINYIWLLPIGIMLNGAYGAFNYLSTRTKNFGAIAKTKVQQASVNLLIQLAGFKLGSISLLIAYILGQGAGSIRLANATSIVKNIERYVSVKQLKKVSVRYKKFPIFSTWEGLLNTLSTQIVNIVCIFFYSPYYVGLYMLVNKTIALPAGLLSSVGGQVFYVHGAEANRSDNLAKLTKDLELQLFRLAALPTVIIIIFGPMLYPIIFGEAFSEASSLVPWVMLWIFIQTISATLTPLISIKEVQHLGVLWNVFLLLSRSLALFVGIKFFDFYTTIVLFSITSLFSYFVLLLWMIKLSGNSLIDILMENVRDLLTAIFFSTPIILFSEINFKGNFLLSLLVLSIGVMICIKYYFDVLKKINFKEYES